MDTKQYINTYTQELGLSKEDTENIGKAREYLNQKTEQATKGKFFLTKRFSSKYKTKHVIESIKECFPRAVFKEESIIDIPIERNGFWKIRWSQVIYNGYNISHAIGEYIYETNFLKSVTNSRNWQTINQIDLFIKITLPQHITNKKKFVSIKKDFRNNTNRKWLYTLAVPVGIVFFLTSSSDNEWSESLYEIIIWPLLRELWINELLFSTAFIAMITFISYSIITRYKNRKSVNLENSTFEKVFDVDSNDSIVARQICNSHTMEQLIERNNAFKQTGEQEFLFTENILCIKYDMRGNSVFKKLENIWSDKQAIQTITEIYIILKYTKNITNHLAIDDIIRNTYQYNQEEKTPGIETEKTVNTDTINTLWPSYKNTIYSTTVMPNNIWPQQQASSTK